MFTNKARLLVAAAFTLLMVFFIFKHTYELAAVALLFTGMLVWGYFKEGTIPSKKLPKSRRAAVAN
jgi:ABC-type polysaccharide/polyol phosphate export permease